MLTRATPVRLRLIRAFRLFSGSVVLLTWVVSMAYFFWSERDELVQTTRVQAAIVAAQSSAAVMFDDSAALQENVSTLQHIRDIRWAVIIEPANQGHARASEPRQLASYGSPPAALAVLLEKLNQRGNTLLELNALTFQQPIVHNGITRAQLLVNVDLSGEVKEFVLISIASLMLNLLFLAGAARVFDRIVQTVATPIGDLAELADQVTTTGTLVSRPEDDFPDEVGQLSRAMSRMLDTIADRERDLSQSQADLRALNNRMRDVRESERKRISHEIHDELGQQMTAIKYELARLEDRKTSVSLGAMIDVAISKVRTISWELRPSVLDTLGLADAIEWMGQDFQQRMGIRCGVRIIKQADVASDQATDVFRICQELLTNITRHAKATRADIALEITESHVELEVSDDGVGISADALNQRSLGFLGIRERSQRWGGTLTVSLGPTGSGTVARIAFNRIPLPRTPEQ